MPKKERKKSAQSRKPKRGMSLLSFDEEEGVDTPRKTPGLRPSAGGGRRPSLVVPVPPESEVVNTQVSSAGEYTAERMRELRLNCLPPPIVPAAAAAADAREEDNEVLIYDVEHIAKAKLARQVARTNARDVTRPSSPPHFIPIKRALETHEAYALDDDLGTARTDVRPVPARNPPPSKYTEVVDGGDDDEPMEPLRGADVPRAPERAPPSFAEAGPRVWWTTPDAHDAAGPPSLDDLTEPIPQPSAAIAKLAEAVERERAASDRSLAGAAHAEAAAAADERRCAELEREMQAATAQRDYLKAFSEYVATLLDCLGDRGPEVDQLVARVWNLRQRRSREQRRRRVAEEDVDFVRATRVLGHGWASSSQADLSADVVVDEDDDEVDEFGRSKSLAMPTDALRGRREAARRLRAGVRAQARAGQSAGDQDACSRPPFVGEGWSSDEEEGVDTLLRAMQAEEGTSAVFSFASSLGVDNEAAELCMQDARADEKACAAVDDVLRQRELIFAEVHVDFASLGSVLAAFKGFRRRLPECWEEAFVGAYLAKVVVPFAKLALLDWRPESTVSWRSALASADTTDPVARASAGAATLEDGAGEDDWSACEAQLHAALAHGVVAEELAAHVHHSYDVASCKQTLAYLLVAQDLAAASEEEPPHAGAFGPAVASRVEAEIARIRLAPCPPPWAEVSLGCSDEDHGKVWTSSLRTFHRSLKIVHCALTWARTPAVPRDRVVAAAAGLLNSAIVPFVRLVVHAKPTRWPFVHHLLRAVVGCLQPFVVGPDAALTPVEAMTVSSSLRALTLHAIGAHAEDMKVAGDTPSTDDAPQHGHFRDLLAGLETSG